MGRGNRKCLCWTGGAGVIVGIVAVVVALVWHQRVLPQATAVTKLVKAGAICLYDFEYDFDVREGRIPNYRRPSASSPLLQCVLGNDWLATPVYVQFTGDQVGDRDVANLCDLLEELPTVCHLNLRGTLVSDKSSLCLKKLQHLRVLDIRDSAFTPKGVEFLKGLLPTCHIFSGVEKEGSFKGP